MQVADTISYFYKANNKDVKMIISQTNVRYFIYIYIYIGVNNDRLNTYIMDIRNYSRR